MLTFSYLLFCFCFNKIQSGGGISIELWHNYAKLFEVTIKNNTKENFNWPKYQFL